MKADPYSDPVQKPTLNESDLIGRSLTLKLLEGKVGEKLQRVLGTPAVGNEFI